MLISLFDITIYQYLCYTCIELGVLFTNKVDANIANILTYTIQLQNESAHVKRVLITY